MRKHKATGEEVELNLTAMLDMAFQILAFFVLTFRPPKAEGQIALRMPPAMPISGQAGGLNPGDKETTDLPKEFKTVLVIVTSTAAGDIRQIYVGRPGSPDKEEVTVDPKLNIFKSKLGSLLNDPASPFDQVVIQVGSTLKYSELMRVIDVCTRQTLGGDPHNRLSKLSLVDENG